MKDLTLLVWLTQLGLSVAAPLAGFFLLALWLRSSLGWGDWVIWVGLVMGLLTALAGFRNALKLMDRLSRPSSAPEKPPVSYSEHI